MITQSKRQRKQAQPTLEGRRSAKPPKYRFKEGYHPAIAQDYKANPQAFIDCGKLPATEQIKLCRVRIKILSERLANYKQQGILAFPTTITQIEGSIQQEQVWISHLEAPISAKTLMGKTQSTARPLFSGPHRRNEGDPSTLIDDRPFAFVPSAIPQEATIKKKTPFAGLVGEELVSIKKIGITARNSVYIVYATKNVTSCQFISLSKLLKAFNDIQKQRTGYDGDIQSAIVCQEQETITFQLTAPVEGVLKNTKVKTEDIAPFLVQWNNQANGFIQMPNSDNQTEQKNQQLALLAEIRKYRGIPEKLVELQIAAVEAKAKVINITPNPFVADIVNRDGELLGKMALSLERTWQMYQADNLAASITVKTAKEGLRILSAAKQLELEFY